MHCKIHPPEIHTAPRNEVIRLKDHLPPEHTAYIEADPVVAFMHTVSLDDDEKGVMTTPLVPNSTGGGFVEILDLDQKIFATTLAAPDSKMYSLYISGPVIRYRYTLGYFLPGQTEIDWEARAVAICDYITAGLGLVWDLIEARAPSREVYQKLCENLECDEPANFFMKILTKHFALIEKDPYVRD